MTSPASHAIDGPAWVQAVGSIAAILVAIWIARRDSRIARAARQERLAGISTLLLKRTQFTLTFMNMIERDLGQAPDTAVFQGKLQANTRNVAVQMTRVRKFEEMAIVDWPTGHLFTAFSEMYDNLSSLEEAMREYVDALTDSKDQKILDAHHSRAALYVAHACDAIQRLQDTARPTATS